MKNMTLHPAAWEFFRSRKMFNGKFEDKVFNEMPFPDGVPKKVTVVVSPLAFTKMVQLIMGFTTEVGWHGLIHRDENDPAKYVLEDVVVYPQNVTGASITCDQSRQMEWLDAFPDEQFKKLRFHGHSHVNMGVFSSSTDDDLQRDLVDMMRNPEDFYVFFIMNKRLELFVRIYDNKYGVMFESRTNDVDIIIGDDTVNINQFIQESRAQVKTITVTPSTTYGNYKGGSVTPSKTTTPTSTGGALPGAGGKTANTGMPQKPYEDEWDDYGYGDDVPYGYYDGKNWVNCRGGWAQ